VKLQSWDDKNKVNENQQYEQWSLSLLNNGSEVRSVGPSDDIRDNRPPGGATKITKFKGIDVSQSVNEYVAKHIGKGVGSHLPVCAALKKTSNQQNQQSVSADLSAKPDNEVEAGKSVTLDVDSNNANNCKWTGSMVGLSDPNAPKKGEEKIGKLSSGSYTYEVTCYGSGPNNKATAKTNVTVQVPAEAKPDKSYSVGVNDTLNVSAPGVLGNDSGATPLEATQVVSGPSAGTVNLFSDGSFEYTPGNSGTHTFKYEMEDGNGNTDTAEVEIETTAPPVAVIEQLPQQDILIGKWLSLNGSNSYDKDPLGPDPQITAYNWTTDPASSVFKPPSNPGKSPNVAFANKGIYDIELGVTDNEGQKASTSATIETTLPSFSLQVKQGTMWVTAETASESTEAQVLVQPGSGFSLTDFTINDFSVKGQSSIGDEDIDPSFNKSNGILTVVAQDDESVNDPIGFQTGTYEIIIEAKKTYKGVEGITHTVTEIATTTLRSQTIEEF